MQFNISSFCASDTPVMTDEEYFGIVNKWGKDVLDFFVGYCPLENKENKTYKYRNKKLARPIHLSYHELILMNLNIEYGDC